MEISSTADTDIKLLPEADEVHDLALQDKSVKYAYRAHIGDSLKTMRTSA